MNFVARALNLSISAAERLRERNILKRAFVKHHFFPDIVEALRLDRKFGFYEEGTVVIKTRTDEFVVRGFPKIKRALTLKPTLKRHFGNRMIAVEEKMNGYNVRIIRAGDSIYAITRRGLICPYTTEKARLEIPLDFFDEYPEFMLCCEAIGRASPYVQSYTYDIPGLEFYLFDIRNRRTNEPIGVEEREEIADRYEIKMVDILLKTNPEKVEDIKTVIEELNSRGREGVVFKDIEMKIDPMKYTTSLSNCYDLNYAFRFFAEYARDFMISRIVREAFQSFEFQNGKREFEERCFRLGKSILKPLIESIQDVKMGKKIVEASELYFYNREVLELFKMHLKLLGVDFRMKVIDEDDEKIKVLLERVMRSTTDRIRKILNGNPWR